MKWEYLLWWGERLEYATLEPLGADGWELVQIIKHPPGQCEKLQAVFKRPKAGEAKP